MIKTTTYTLVIETDESRQFVATIDDWFMLSGRGDTPSEAIADAVNKGQEWLDMEESE